MLSLIQKEQMENWAGYNDKYEKCILTLFSHLMFFSWEKLKGLYFHIWYIIIPYRTAQQPSLVKKLNSLKLNYHDDESEFGFTVEVFGQHTMGYTLALLQQQPWSYCIHNMIRLIPHWDLIAWLHASFLSGIIHCFFNWFH